MAKLLTTFPDDQIAAQARYHASDSLIVRRNVDRALRLARLAIETEPQGEFADAIARWAATNPYSVYQHTDIAIQFAELAIEAEPEVADYWTTLGIARYRAGESEDAKSALQKAVELHGEASAIDAFFLAMTNWRLDNQVDARNWYHQAVGLTEAIRPDDQELLRFRSEAAELLGIEDRELSDTTTDN